MGEELPETVDKTFAEYIRLQNYRVMTYNGRLIDLTDEEAEHAKRVVYQLARARPEMAKKLETFYRRMRVKFRVLEGEDSADIIAAFDSIVDGTIKILAGPDFALCLKCLKADHPFGEEPELSRCARCKSITYCCRRAQKEDWRIRHKEICKKE